MRQTIYIFLVLTIGFACSFAAPEGARLALDSRILDFGDIPAGTTVTDTVRFVNNGDTDLVVKSVSTSCGCTVAEYTREPVKPDSVGFVTVKFNSTGRAPGRFRKSVRIRSNAINYREILYVDGNIIEEK